MFADWEEPRVAGTASYFYRNNGIIVFPFYSESCTQIAIQKAVL